MIRIWVALIATLLSLTAVADQKISALPAAGPLTGTESIPAVQPGSCPTTGGTCQTTPAAISTYTNSHLPATISSNTTGTAAGLSSVLTTSSGGTGATSLSGAFIPIFSGAITTGDCVKWLSATSIGDAGAACGSGGGGTPGGTSGQIQFNNAGAFGGISTTGSGNVVLATSPTLVTPALGTPSSATLTNATGLPISTGVSGLGTGVATFLATPSSANLAGALTDETGTGAAVFATSPTLTTPNLGTPSALVLTNATALPLSALANQGTTTTVLHGNAAGNPSFGAVGLTTDVTGVLPAANGGNGNGFFAVSGPATTTKTFTFPNASATVLTSNAAVTVAQGGTGLASLTAHDVLVGAGTGNVGLVAPSATSGVPLISQGSAADPTYGAVNLAGGSSIVSGTLPVANGGTGATTLAGANIATFSGVITSGHCAQFSGTTGTVVDSGSGCGAAGAVSSVSAGSSGSVSVSPTTGAVVVDLASASAGTVLANTTGSSAAPIPVTMANLQAALIAANAVLVTATMVTGPTFDYSPTGFGTTTGVLYLTPASGGSTLGGLVAGSAMQQLFMINAEAAGGADAIVLKNQSASETTAANRFMSAGDLSIPPGGGVQCLYLASTINRWWCH